MKFTIRPNKESDAEKFEFGFKAQGWSKPADQYKKYFREQCQGARRVFVAEHEGQVLGYLTLVKEAGAGPFMGKEIPEIADFNVLKDYQCHGVGSALMDAVEAYAFTFSDEVCLGVGLHMGYGSAQRMYVKRGYVPDGSGVWYRDRRPDEMEPVCNDDALILYLSKKLR